MESGLRLRFFLFFCFSESGAFGVDAIEGWGYGQLLRNRLHEADPIIDYLIRDFWLHLLEM